jgi:hypothetical protein
VAQLHLLQGADLRAVALLAGELDDLLAGEDAHGLRLLLFAHYE